MSESLILYTVEGNCTDTECDRNQHCIVADDGREVCICNNGYVYDPSTNDCEREFVGRYEIGGGGVAILESASATVLCVPFIA